MAQLWPCRSHKLTRSRLSECCILPDLVTPGKNDCLVQNEYPHHQHCHTGSRTSSGKSKFLAVFDTWMDVNQICQTDVQFPQIWIKTKRESIDYLTRALMLFCGVFSLQFAAIRCLLLMACVHHHVYHSITTSLILIPAPDWLTLAYHHVTCSVIT